MLGVTAELIKGLWLKVGKNRVLSQHRKFAVRDSVTFARPLLRHASQTPENLRGCSYSVINAGRVFNRKASNRDDLVTNRRCTENCGTGIAW